MALNIQALDCSRLGYDLAAANCDRPPIAGTGSRVILINYSDIDRSASTITDGVISSIVLKSGARAYEFVTLPDSTIGSWEGTINTYYNTYSHSVELHLHAMTENAKKWARSIKNAKVVAVVEHNETGEAGEVQYNAYGWYSGLRMSAASGSTTMDDQIVGTWTLSSTDQSQEGGIPYSVWKTSTSATLTMLNALVAGSSSEK